MQMMQKIPTYIVDSFTTQKFKGNPAGVCLPTEPLTDVQMLNIANELGFSETAFVLFDDTASHQKIRFFTPLQEIDLCGHATLAMAKILFQLDKVSDIVKFKNINDIELIVEQKANRKKLLMAFPAYFVHSCGVPSSMLQALGIHESSVVNTGYNQEINSFIIEINSCKNLVNLSPDFIELVKSYPNIDGVVVTACSDKAEYDFESRYFWPWVGTNEDPVTGAIHTFLSTYWAKKLGKTKMSALQCSARSGSIQLELMDNDMVILQGDAQIVLKGVLEL